MELGVDVNQATSDGVTALMVASERGNHPTFGVLHQASQLLISCTVVEARDDLALFLVLYPVSLLLRSLALVALRVLELHPGLRVELRLSVLTACSRLRLLRAVRLGLHGGHSPRDGEASAAQSGATGANWGGSWGEN